ncbi:MAG: hypothetical protein HKN81_11645 [Gammaproteobacteria bacterium]|nr:hypothetical protein [Gammaproteobacteria bacterium]NND37775.1 hypothetical protein [Gammaproteobacteria bacterium]
MSGDRSLDTLKRGGLHLVRFLSTIAMDPHLYFEQKLSAEIRTSESFDELSERLAQLVTWMDGLGLQPAQLHKLDAELEAEGLPSLAAMRRGDR